MVCEIEFRPTSLKFEGERKGSICTKCRSMRKQSSAVQSANKRKQTEYLALQTRIERMEEKISMFDTIVESITRDIAENVAIEQVKSMEENILKNILGLMKLFQDKMQAQVMDINNKIIRNDKHE
tara:strand:- start:13325 stop:13699 length:375 start_codon:yes stop_codon:yes gene_type:complete